MSQGQDYGPSFELCRLYKKTGKTGNEYFTGRLGGCRVALLKSKFTADDGAEIWRLMLSEAPKKEGAEAGAGTRSVPRNDPKALKDIDAQDEIPF